MRGQGPSANRSYLFVMFHQGLTSLRLLTISHSNGTRDCADGFADIEAPFHLALVLCVLRTRPSGSSENSSRQSIWAWDMGIRASLVRLESDECRCLHMNAEQLPSKVIFDP